MGSASVKWHSQNFDGHFWSDHALQAQYPSSYAFLDFYQLHYYDWMEPWFGSPIQGRSPQQYGLNDRPVIVGELPIHPSYYGGTGVNLTVNEAFEAMRQAGYAGHYPWESAAQPSHNHVGLFSDMAEAAQQFSMSHRDIVAPLQRRIMFNTIPAHEWQHHESHGVVTSSEEQFDFNFLSDQVDQVFRLRRVNDG